VFGPRETNPHVIPAILERYRQDEEIPIGNVWPRRDYVFAQDVADALIALSDGPPGWDRFNVGTGVGTTVVEVLETMGALTGRRVRYRHAPEFARSDDGHLVSDNRKILKQSGWRPRFDVEDGMREVLVAAGLLSRPERSPVATAADADS
jgi:UDP-glucose 4-epimerase